MVFGLDIYRFPYPLNSGFLYSYVLSDRKKTPSPNLQVILYVVLNLQPQLAPEFPLLARQFLNELCPIFFTMVIKRMTTVGKCITLSLSKSAIPLLTLLEASWEGCK